MFSNWILTSPVKLWHQRDHWPEGYDGSDMETNVGLLDGLAGDQLMVKISAELGGIPLPTIRLSTVFRYILLVKIPLPAFNGIWKQQSLPSPVKILNFRRSLGDCTSIWDWKHSESCSKFDTGSLNSINGPEYVYASESPWSFNQKSLGNCLISACGFTAELFLAQEIRASLLVLRLLRSIPHREFCIFLAPMIQ